MIVLDTTVLVYAVGADHPLRSACRDVLQAHSDGVIEAATTIEVLQEFAHVRARRRTRGDAVQLAGQLARSLTIVDTQVTDLERGLRLFLEHMPLGAFDSVLAAAAIRHGAEFLVSADRAFAGVSQLRHVQPNSSALRQRLHRRS